ncbi:MAG TPA: hypothetical protein VKJ00_03455 [Thermoanaerobaculia bacterium]|nr:hypothetical protein [Thermoanaerobaculia bacterium]
MRRALFSLAAFFLAAVCASAQSSRPRAISLAPPVGPAVVAVVPVVISSPGAHGASYHTSVQAYNPSAASITGTFLLRQPTSGPPLETTLPFSINPGQTVSYADLLVSMGVSGIGSLDVVGATGMENPVLSVRVYNDAGGTGTTGSGEDAVLPSNALAAGQSAALIAPLDAVALRFNVGVRAFDSGATIQATLRDKAGAVRTTVTRSFAPNSLQQTDAASFLGGVAPGPSDTITVDVSEGSVMIYGVTADNQTGDPAISIGRRISQE